MIARYQHLNDNSVIDAMTGTNTEGKEIPTITTGTSQVDELRAQIYENEKDMQVLIGEIERQKHDMDQMKKFMSDPAMILALADALKNKMKK